MAAPAAEVPSKDERRKDRSNEEDETRVDVAEFKCLHRFARLDGRDGRAGDNPLQYVRHNQEMHRDEHRGPPAPHA